MNDHGAMREHFVRDELEGDISHELRGDYDERAVKRRKLEDDTPDEELYLAEFIAMVEEKVGTSERHTYRWQWGRRNTYR